MMKFIEIDAEASMLSTKQAYKVIIFLLVCLLCKYSVCPSFVYTNLYLDSFSPMGKLHAKLKSYARILGQPEEAGRPKGNCETKQE